MSSGEGVGGSMFQEKKTSLLPVNTTSFLALHAEQAKREVKEFALLLQKRIRLFLILYVRYVQR